MVWPLEKRFLFITAYSTKECRKALSSLESGQSNMKLLGLDDKGSEIFCKLARRYDDKGRYFAYSEAQIKLSEQKNTVNVSGNAKIFILQIILYLYFAIVLLILAFVFRPILIVSLFLLLGALFPVHWLRLLFTNRKCLIREIEDLLKADPL
jgi:hypothetical protein